MLLQPGILKKICPTLDNTRADIITQHINNICPQYGIINADILHEFLANILHESNEFRRYEENLNYSSEALIKKFSRERISTEDAIKYGRNSTHPADQKNIANRIYGGTWGKLNLGNTQPADGFDLRGSGGIQLTGRGMFEAFAAFMKKKFNVSKTIYEWTELLRTSDEWSMHAACWFFCEAKNLEQLAINDEFEIICKRINGGYNGLEERKKYYDLCKRYIV